MIIAAPSRPRRCMGQIKVCPKPGQIFSLPLYSKYSLWLLRSLGGGSGRGRIGLVVFLDKVIRDVGGLSGEEQNARLLGRAAFEHHHDATLLAVGFEELADLFVYRRGDFRQAPLTNLAVILFLTSERFLLISGFFSPLTANLDANGGSLSIDLVLETIQGVIFSLDFLLLRFELGVEGVDFDLQLTDVRGELAGVDVGQLTFRPS